ncbi:hypothetical protein DFH08DRAFT_815105 [Mycena albidolilacea]|uniref:Uncharacterized protein n=1 Tax=Mycena albidolilacea TaxID=1033008 RepID=A0AAD6ZPV8_9AGAR|nr:hypothetical protein DFH08DRAFT_815105 [Mycena albidolilacea]
MKFFNKASSLKSCAAVAPHTFQLVAMLFVAVVAAVPTEMLKREPGSSLESEARGVVHCNAICKPVDCELGKDLLLATYIADVTTANKDEPHSIGGTPKFCNISVGKPKSHFLSVPDAWTLSSRLTANANKSMFFHLTCKLEIGSALTRLPNLTHLAFNDDSYVPLDLPRFYESQIEGRKSTKEKSVHDAHKGLLAECQWSATRGILIARVSRPNHQRRLQRLGRFRRRDLAGVFQQRVHPAFVYIWPTLPNPEAEAAKTPLRDKAVRCLLDGDANLDRSSEPVADASPRDADVESSADVDVEERELEEDLQLLSVGEEEEYRPSPVSPSPSPTPESEEEAEAPLGNVPRVLTEECLCSSLSSPMCRRDPAAPSDVPAPPSPQRPTFHSPPQSPRSDSHSSNWPRGTIQPVIWGFRGNHIRRETIDRFPRHPMTSRNNRVSTSPILQDQRSGIQKGSDFVPKDRPLSWVAEPMDA